MDYTHKGDMKDHALILYGTTIGMNAKTVFEIGVRRGASTMMFLLALRQTGGHLLSIDINPRAERTRDVVERNGLGPYWTFIHADSKEFWKRWPLSDPVDIMFIDGDHTLEGVMSDFRNYSGKVRKDGLILLHDSFCDDVTIASLNIGVHHLVQELREMSTTFELVTLPYCYGLTIMRKLV